MTPVQELIGRIRSAGCSVNIEGKDGIRVRDKDAALPVELVEKARQMKPALIVELLRLKAQELKGFIDGQAPYAQRIVKMAEYQDTTDRLSQAEGRLFETFRAAGFTVVWSMILQEMILVGNGSPPPGSEAYVTYSWEELEALRDAGPEAVFSTHQVKKAFAGKVTA